MLHILFFLVLFTLLANASTVASVPNKSNPSVGPDGHPTVFLAKFTYQKQIRAMDMGNGVKVIEPIGTRVSINLHVRRDPNNNNKLTVMRTKHNMHELLNWCNDEDEGFRVTGVAAHRQKLSQHSTYIPASPNAQKFEADDDLLEHNVFLMDVPPQHQQYYKPLVVMTVGFASIGYHFMRERHRQQLAAKYFTCCHGEGMIKYPPCDCAFKPHMTCSIPCYRQCTPYEGRSVPYKINLMMEHIRRLFGEDTQIVLAGNGFGGGAASVATTYYYRSSWRKPTSIANGTVEAITFNAPGDFWYLRRLGLYPMNSTEPNSNLPIYNIGTTLSPLFQNQITGYLAFGVYPYQTTCRSGLECPIPAIDSGNRSGDAYHSRKMLQKIVGVTRLKDTEELACHAVLKCEDCDNWKFSENDIYRHIITLHG